MDVFIHEVRLHPDRIAIGPIPAPALDAVDFLETSGWQSCPPLILSPSEEDSGYFLLSGEIWWIAAQYAGVDKLPAKIHKGSNAQARTLLQIDVVNQNNPMMVARLIDRLRGSGKTRRSVTDVSRDLRMNRATAAHHVRLLNLSPVVQDMVASGTLTLNQVKPLVSLPEKLQAHVAQRIVRNASQWPVHKINAMCKVLLHGDSPGKKPDADLVRLENTVSEQVGCPAQIDWDANHGGELRFTFTDLDVLEGILERLGVREGEG